MAIGKLGVRGGGLGGLGTVATVPVGRRQLSGSAVDLNFATGQYYGGTLSALTSTSRASTGYATNADGTLTLFQANQPRIGRGNGLLVEEARTNVVLWNRDLTNAAWTSTNVTPLLNQIGADGTANGASSITATAGNGTCLQAITLASSARFQTAYVKRLVGAGTINMTMDNGATWTVIAVTSAWTQVSIPTQTLADPTVGFRIVTNGDSIAVDLVQNENGAFATSAIPTTTVAVTRAADVVSLIGAAQTALQGAAWSYVLSVGPQLGTGVNPRLLGDSTNGFVTYMGGATTVNSFTGGNAATTNSFPTLSNKIAQGQSGTTQSMAANGGAVNNSASPNAVPTITYLGGDNGASPYSNGYFKRLSLWTSRLSDATLQVLST